MPTTDSLLLDTNAASAVIRGDSSATQVIRQATRVYVPCIVVGELFYGAYHAPTPAKQLERVERFVARNAVLFLDSETLRLYGLIRAELRAKGQLIPVNDTWIASLARQHGLAVMTNDRHFEHVDGLTVINW